MKDETLRQVGQKIKQIRKRKHLSLHEVAVRSQVTAGLISKIENFRTIPSLPVLLNISRALEVELTELVSEVNNKDQCHYQLIKHDDREKLEDKSGFMAGLMLKQEMGNLYLRTRVLDIEPQASSSTYSGEGAFIFFLLQGELKVSLREEEIELQKGDNLYFDGRLTHKLSNPGPKQASVLVTEMVTKEEGKWNS